MDRDDASPRDETEDGGAFRHLPLGSTAFREAMGERGIRIEDNQIARGKRRMRFSRSYLPPFLLFHDPQRLRHGFLHKRCSAFLLEAEKCAELGMRLARPHDGNPLG